MSGAFDGARDDVVIFDRLRATGALTAPRRRRRRYAGEVRAAFFAGLVLAGALVLLWL